MLIPCQFYVTMSAVGIHGSKYISIRLGKFLLGVLFVVLIIEIIVIFPRDLDDKAKPQSGPVAPDDGVSKGIEQIMRGAHLVETREGEKEWELWAESAIAYKLKPSWSLRKVKTRLFGKDGVFFIVTGDEGSIDVKTKDMDVKGKVVIRSSNGYAFETEKMIYHSKERQFVAPLPVFMRGPKDGEGFSLILRGNSLSADLNNSLMTVNGGVKGEKAFKGDRRLLIRAQKAAFSGKSNLARFSEDVVMDFETMRITGPEAVFEYGREQNLVKSVQVFGGVRVSDLEKWVTSQKVNVNFDKDRYVFSGNPRVVQNNDELQGEEIVFLEGGKKVEVFKARANVVSRELEKAN